MQNKYVFLFSLFQKHLENKALFHIMWETLYPCTPPMFIMTNGPCLLNPTRLDQPATEPANLFHITTHA